MGQLHASEKLEVTFTFCAASGFPRTESLGLRVVPIADTLDADKDGNTTELVPQRDATGLPVYTADFGSVSNLLRARFPVFAPLDLRLNWKRRRELPVALLPGIHQRHESHQRPGGLKPN